MDEDTNGRLEGQVRDEQQTDLQVCAAQVDTQGRGIGIQASATAHEDAG